MHDVLVVALLVLSSWRATRLITKDTFPPLLAVRDRLAGGWRPMTSEELSAWAGTPDQQEIDGVRSVWHTRSDRSPFWLAELVSCGWCASGWVSGALTAATALVTSLPDPWLVGPAVWAGAALLSTREWA